jgi:hypothetical protein
MKRNTFINLSLSYLTLLLVTYEIFYPIMYKEGTCWLVFFINVILILGNTFFTERNGEGPVDYEWVMERKNNYEIVVLVNQFILTLSILLLIVFFRKYRPFSIDLWLLLPLIILTIFKGRKSLETIGELINDFW